MGGMGSGQGAKIGTGPKPKMGPLPPAEPFEPTEEMTEAERKVWDRLSGRAFARRTLTKSTELAFVILCQNLVMRGELAA
jgi:hypothetical protein